MCVISAASLHRGARGSSPRAAETRCNVRKMGVCQHDRYASVITASGHTSGSASGCGDQVITRSAELGEGDPIRRKMADIWPLAQLPSYIIIKTCLAQRPFRDHIHSLASNVCSQRGLGARWDRGPPPSPPPASEEAPAAAPARPAVGSPSRPGPWASPSERAARRGEVKHAGSKKRSGNARTNPKDYKTRTNPNIEPGVSYLAKADFVACAVLLRGRAAVSATLRETLPAKDSTKTAVLARRILSLMRLSNDIPSRKNLSSKMVRCLFKRDPNKQNISRRRRRNKDQDRFSSHTKGSQTLRSPRPRTPSPPRTSAEKEAVPSFIDIANVAIKHIETNQWVVLCLSFIDVTKVAINKP